MSLLTNVLKLWRTGQYLLPADSGFMVKHLFANGEPGFAKLDFSGFAGMYQDRARTIPYTAVEQPLGSFTGLNGVTATAPADVNRGVVSARVNRIFLSTGFAASAAHPLVGWVDNSASGWMDNYGTAPDGTTSTTLVIPGGTRYTGIVLPTGSKFTYSIYIKKKVGATYELYVDSNVVGGPTSAIFNAETGDANDVTPSVLGYGAVDHGDFWRIFLVGEVSLVNGWVTPHIYGGVLSVEVWGAQCTVGAELKPYQGTRGTSYDTVGFPHYLTFNGTNTTYVTPSIDFTGTDKMTVWAGVEKMSDAHAMGVMELTGDSAITDGSFMLRAVDYNGGTEVSSYARGNSAYHGQVIGGAAVVAPVRYIHTLAVDLSASAGNQVESRFNGAGFGAPIASVGGGNFANAPLYIGSQNGGAYNFLEGSISSLIVRGAATSQPTKEAVNNLIKNIMRLP